MSSAVATFAGGCFWGIEEGFTTISGVISTKVGFMGGHMKDPEYEDVLTDTTGHAEVVQVVFDTDTLSYGQLIKHFFQLHNPSAMPGSKYKYRSAIFFHDAQQERIASGFILELKLSGLYALSVKTTVVPAGVFYKAKEHHQHYYEKNP